MDKYKDYIEKVAKLDEEEKARLGQLRKDLSSTNMEQQKQNLKNMGMYTAGLGGIYAGAPLVAKANKDGAIDGMVRRYHNAKADNVSGILEQGLKGSKATDPRFNNLTRMAAGLNDEEMEGLTYLGKKKSLVRGIGARREQMDSLLNNVQKTEQEALRDSFKTQKTLKVNIPLTEYKKMNKVDNPELRGAKNWKEFDEIKKKLNPFQLDFTPEQTKKTMFANLSEGTDTIKGDVASKFIKGGKGYKGNSLKNIATHIKDNPKMVAKGLSKATLGAGLAGAGAYGLGKAIKGTVDANKNRMEKSKEYRNLLIKNKREEGKDING